MQGYVDNLEASVNDRISWPLVSYCDDIRNIFFTPETAQIFYSLTREHNYSIAPYSDILKASLRDLLTAAQLEATFKGPTVFRLSLASLEDDNLPLYANIGHEFGHALFSIRKRELAAMISPRFTGIFQKAEVAWAALPPEKRAPLLTRLSRYFFFGLGEELYCDLVGSLLMGPAFFLSLYEMLWGAPKNLWVGNIDRTLDCYPSLNFRLQLIKRWIGLDGFVKDATRDFARLQNPELKGMTVFLSSVPTDDTQDAFRITRTEFADEYEKFLVANLAEIKTALAEFITDCHDKLQEEFKDKLPKVSSGNIANLLQRLENDILPNIIPNSTIYGTPAQFQDILNAAAIYRASLLLKSPPPAGIREDLQKIERLTSKALEVSYIQMKFKNRVPANGNS